MIYEFVGEIVIICVGIEYMYLLMYVNFFMIYFLYFERGKKRKLLKFIYNCICNVRVFIILCFMFLLF